MSIIERLRGKLRAKSEDHKAQYWGTLQKIASGKLSERAADEALEALATTMELLGKSADDAQTDVELLEQMAEAESRTKGFDDAKKAHRAAIDARSAAQKRVEQLLLESQKIAREGDQAVHTAGARVAGIESAMQECVMIRNKLGQAGHPESQHRRAGDEARGRFEARARDLEWKLDEVSREIRSAESSLANAKEGPPSYRGEGDAIESTLHHLKSKRDDITRQLAELRREEEVRVATARSGGKALGGVS